MRPLNYKRMLAWHFAANNRRRDEGRNTMKLNWTRILFGLVLGAAMLFTYIAVAQRASIKVKTNHHVTFDVPAQEFDAVTGDEITAAVHTVIIERATYEFVDGAEVLGPWIEVYNDVIGAPGYKSIEVSADKGEYVYQGTAVSEAGNTSEPLEALAVADVSGTPPGRLKYLQVTR